MRRALAATILVLLCGCQTARVNEYNPSVDSWPLLRMWSESAPESHHVEGIFPVVESHNSADERDFYLRPFFSSRTNKQSGVTEWDFLWPFVFGTKRTDLNRFWIFPLFLRDRETLSDGRVQSRTIFLPFYYRHADGAAKESFFIFPFGGVIRDIVGRKQATIVMWPLYVHQTGDEAKSWSVLHPIFSYTRWNDGGRGYKFWPLFGVNRRPGTMSKVFILWPIYHNQWQKLPQGERRRWWLFPFYGTIKDPGGWEWSALWPFFSGRYEKYIDEKTYWYPWPLLGHKSGKNVWGRMFYPIYATTRQPNRRHDVFLWPFGWYNRAQLQNEEQIAFHFFPLMFREQERVDGVPMSGAWQVWPLIKHQYEADGIRRVEFPSLWPTRNFGPWERNYAPFFRLFEYRRDMDGTRSWRVLHRLARVDSAPGLRYVEVWPLISVQSGEREEEVFRWKFPKGLADYERTPEGKQYRLLYFIHWRTGRQKP